MNKTAEQIQKEIDEAADKYGFQVPYNGSNEFYNHDKVNGFLEGAKFALQFSQPPAPVEEGERIKLLEYIIETKEKERKEWADLCIKKQARIDELENPLSSLPPHPSSKG